MASRSLLAFMTCMFATVLVLTVLRASPQTLHFYVFGTGGCPACSMLKTLLASHFGEDSLTFYDIVEKREYALVLAKIYEFILPNSSSRPIPLTGVFANGRIRAVVVGFHKVDFWEKLSRKLPEKGVLLVTKDGESILDEKLVGLLTKFFTNPESVERIWVEEEVGRILPFVLACALADSVNPCTFAVFTALLLVTLHAAGRHRTLASGLSFILAVYLVYLLVGLNVVRVFVVYPQAKYIIAFLGILIGVGSMFSAVRGKPLSLVPGFARREVDKLVSSKPLSAVMAFTVGVIVSLTLLPCTSGPYLVALSLMGTLPPLDVLALLALYNAIFIAPLIAILALVLALGAAIRKLKVFRTKYTWILSTIEGVLLIVISLYILST